LCKQSITWCVGWVSAWWPLALLVRRDSQVVTRQVVRVMLRWFHNLLRKLGNSAPAILVHHITQNAPAIAAGSCNDRKESQGYRR